MNTLCIDSTGLIAKISLIKNNEVDGFDVQSPHSENLLSKIEELLENNGIEVNELDNIAVVVGPGSFTGIRIGVTIVKGIAVVNTKAKLVSISNFDLVAQNIKSSKDFIVVLDSGNEGHYVALYKDFVCQRFLSMKSGEVNAYALSNNLEIFATLNEQEKLKDVNAEFLEIDENTLSEIASKKINKNEYKNINELVPIYVKPSQAEKQRQEKIMSELQILPANDYEQIINIENECFEEKWSVDTIKNELIQNYKYYFVAKYNDVYVGYIGLELAGDNLNLLKLAVLKDYRECGVASALVNYSLEKMKELDAKVYFLEVDEKNTSAINLYKKLGFETKNIRERYYKNGNNCLVMFYNSSTKHNL